MRIVRCDGCRHEIQEYFKITVESTANRKEYEVCKECFNKIKKILNR